LTNTVNQHSVIQQITVFDENVTIIRRKFQRNNKCKQIQSNDEWWLGHRYDWKGGEI